MQDTTGPALFEVELLPARAAYLIRAGSRSGFRRAVQEASTRWGGMCEPIVSVRKGGSFDGWSGQVVEVARLDALVNVDVPKEDAAAAARKIGLPLVELSEIDRWGAAAWTANPSALPALFESVPVIAERGAPLWQIVSVGDLTDEAEHDLQSAQVFTRRVSEPDGIGRAAVLRHSLIEQTVSRFRENRLSPAWGSTPSIIWVVRNDSLSECIFFWNLRAIRPLRFSPSSVIVLPEDGVEHWIDFDKQLHAQLLRPDEFSPDVVINSWAVPEDQLKSIGLSLGLTESAEAVRSGHRIPAPVRTAPFTFLTNTEPRDWFVGERRYGEADNIEAIVHGGDVRLRFNSTVPFERPGRTKLRVRSDVFASIPRRPFLAGLIHRDATWNEESIQIAVSAQESYNLDLHIPTPREVNEALLTHSVEAHSLSDKGKTGSALLALDANNALLELGVFAAIRALTTPRSKELLRELQKLSSDGIKPDELREIASRWGGRGERRIRSARQLRSTSNVFALELLCANGWAERGMECRCHKCGLTSFVPLTQIEGQATCPSCGSAASYTSDTSGPDIYYRLNAFLDHASDQGVIPHVLAIESLRTTRTGVWLLPGVDLTFADSRRAEVDLFGVIEGRVSSGEMKTSPAEFSESQISNDIKNAVALSADVYVLGAPHALSESQIELVSDRATRSGLELIVLGPADLQPKSVI